MTTGGKLISLKKLPVGYRLNLSDEVLVSYYLKRKLLNIEEECCLIPEFDIYKLPPWDLVTKYNDLSDLASDGGDCFFYHRWSDPSSKRRNRMTKEGYWSDTGGEQKPRVTGKTKWLKKILVYRLGRQKSAVKTEWAMHEYLDISNPAIVVCRIHKSKPKKVEERVDSGSSKACFNGSCRATTCSKTQIQPPEVSPETPVDTPIESQSLTNTNNPEYCTSFPKQTQVDTERTFSLFEDTYSNCLHLTDLKNPQSPQILMSEEPPFSKNVFINGCDQEPGFVSPPQHPQKMPTEGISPIITNSELDIHGWGAQLPVVSVTHGVQETYFKEAPQSTLNSQTPIPPPNLFLVSPKGLQMPQELSSIYNMDPSSDSSGGGSPNAFPFGQSCESQQPHSKVTQDFATGSPAAAQLYDINSLLDSFFASPLLSPFNSQTPIPPPNSYLLPQEEIQMLPKSSSICNGHPSSESSAGGCPSAVHFGQIFESHQTNLEVTQNGSYQVGGSQTYPQGVTLEEGGDMSVYHQIPTDQSSNCVLPGFLYLPQHPGTMPMEEISPIVGNTSFNDSGSELDIHGRDVQLPFASRKHGAQETNFEEFPQSTLNSQTNIPQPNSFLFSPKELMLQELSSISGTNPSSDSSGGGIPNLFHSGQSYKSHQTNFKVTRDGSYPVGGSNTYPRGVTLEEGGDMSVYSQIPTDQSSNCVLPGFLYPPQHPGRMPTEEISPIVGNTSFNDRGNELDIHRPAAELPFPSWKHGAQEINFRVTPDFATGSSAVIQYLDTGLLFDSFLASPLLPEAETEGSSLSSSSIVPGEYGTEYCGLPYASGVALDKSNHRISATY